MTYEIVPEIYTTAPTEYGRNHIPGLLFEYAIKRDDGSLVFRAETHEVATEILVNLEHGHDSA